MQVILHVTRKLVKRVDVRKKGDYQLFKTRFCKYCIDDDANAAYSTSRWRRVCRGRRASPPPPLSIFPLDALVKLVAQDRGGVNSALCWLDV